jgi:HEAT repeat protein
LRSRPGVELAHQTLAQVALPELSPEGKTAAVRQLIPILTGTNEDFAGTACFILSKMAPESIDPLIAILGGNDDEARETAATSLAMMGTNGEPAIPALRKLLADPRLTVRMQAATALNGLGASPMSLLPAMVQGIADLKDPDTLVANLNEAMQKFSEAAGRNAAQPTNGTNRVVK